MNKILMQRENITEYIIYTEGRCLNLKTIAAVVIFISYSSYFITDKRNTIIITMLTPTVIMNSNYKDMKTSIYFIYC